MRTAGRLEAVRRLRPAHEQGHRGPALVGGANLAVAGAPLHRRHVAQGEEAPVVAGTQRQPLEAGLVALLVEGAELLGGGVATDVAGREVDALGRDPAGDVRERHVQLAERRTGHLDGELLLRQSDDVDLGDAAREQLALDPARDGAQRPPVTADHQQPGHLLVVDDPRDHRLLGRRGQVPDRSDPFLRLVEGDVHVGPLFVLQRDLRRPPARCGRHHLHRADPEQLALDGLGDRRLHVLRRGPRPLHVDDDEVDVEGREELRVEPGEGPRSDEQHDRHQQVAGDRMAREDPDEALRTGRRRRACGGRRLGHRRHPSIHARVSRAAPR